jgi:hypothetical protein
MKNNPVSQLLSHENGHRRVKVAVLLMLILAIASSALFFVRLQRQVDPDDLFDAMLKNSLSLKTYSVDMRITSADQQNASTELRGQVADDGGQTEADLSLDLKSTSGAMRLEATKAQKSLFIKVSQFPAPLPPVTLNEAVIGRWASLDETRPLEYPKDANELLIAGTATRTGHVPRGNFKRGDRETLLTYMKDKQVYVHNMKPVRFQHEGHDVYLYDVSVNLDKLQGLNREVARLSGEDYGRIAERYNRQEKTDLRLMVDVATEQLVEAQNSSNDTHTTIRYSSHNEPRTVTMPDDTVKAESLNMLLSKAVR